MAVHTSITYTGLNMPDVKAMLADHFASDSYNLKKGKDYGVIEVCHGDILFAPGDTLHIKRESILVDRKLRA